MRFVVLLTPYTSLCILHCGSFSSVCAVSCTRVILCALWLILSSMCVKCGVRGLLLECCSCVLPYFCVHLFSLQCGVHCVVCLLSSVCSCSVWLSCVLCGYFVCSVAYSVECGASRGYCENARHVTDRERETTG